MWILKGLELTEFLELHRNTTLRKIDMNKNRGEALFLEEIG